MKFLHLVTFSGCTILQVASQNGSESKRPGYCRSDAECTKEAPNYSCVSVQTTRPGTIDVKQCAVNKDPGDVCLGLQAGGCPSFSVWPPAYQKISAVCTYIVPSAKCKDPNTPTQKGYVDCLTVHLPNSETQQAIYGCVDVDIDQKRLLFAKNSKSDKLAVAGGYAELAVKQCLNPKDPTALCTGRGTCVPTSDTKYACKCTTGYEGTLCNKIVTNACVNYAQCAAGYCNLKTQTCECPEGTGGNQCAFCNPSSSKACNGHGTCAIPNGQSSGTSTMSNGTLSSTGSIASTASTGLSNAPVNNMLSLDSSNSQTPTTNGRFLQDNNNKNLKSVCTCDDKYTGVHCDKLKASDTPVPSDDSGNPDNSDTTSDSTQLVMSLGPMMVICLGLGLLTY